MNWQLELTPYLWEPLRQVRDVPDRFRECLRPTPLTAGQTLFLGRHRDCDIFVPHRPVERRKLKIWHDGEAVWLLDLQSLSGTWCQGHTHPEIRPANGPTRLDIDDWF